MTLLEIPAERPREISTPVLETERLLLRAPTIEDAKAIAKLANDRRIAENTARIPHPYALADAKQFIASAKTSADELVFLVTLANSGVVGACGIARLDGQSPELGYWLGVRHWGQGYATEAVRAVIDHAFTQLAYDALAASARVTNPASRRVLEKCGFQWTGAGLCRVRALASSVPIDRFRLDRGLWASLKSWGQDQARGVTSST
jgi:RimJ/RimL family protein N-acetyltransferase